MGIQPEYLVVHFPTPRGVLVDGRRHGQTEELIPLEGGAHLVSLVPPPDFYPLAREVELRNTTPLSPAHASFQPMAPPSV